MVTQLEIAKEVGLDVSTVNKILNRCPGPVFKKETIERVFRVAKRRGFVLRSESKPVLKRRIAELEALLQELVPRVLKPEEIAARNGLLPARAKEILEKIWGKVSA